MPPVFKRQNLNFERGSEIRRSVPLISNTQNLSYISPFNRPHNTSNPAISTSNFGGSLRQHRSAMNGEPMGTYPKKSASKQNGNENLESQKKSKSFFQIFSKNDKKDSKKDNKTGTAIDAKSLSSPFNLPTNIPEDMKVGIDIKVRKTGKMLPLGNDTIPTYDTKSKRSRGKVLLINNIDFKPPRYRDGASVDHRNLQNLFRKMGFSVYDYKNKSKKVGFEKIFKIHSRIICYGCFCIIGDGKTNHRLLQQFIS